MKHLFMTLLCLSVVWTLGAQVPQKFNYQGVARSANGSPLANKNLGLRISVLDGASTALYTETHTVTTNAFGLYTLWIGDGAPVSGSLDNDWLAGERFLKVEMDAAGGTAYQTLGTPVQLVAVPYAMAAHSLLATSGGGGGLRGAATSGLWWGFYEAGQYRGYIGSYAGKNEDVDFGTGAGNTQGSVHLTVASVPKLTVDSIGNVGVGTRFPRYRLQVDGVTGSFNDNGIRINNVTANSAWSFYSSSSGALILGKNGNLGQFSGTTGAYLSLSDLRLKTNIRQMESVLPRIKLLEAKRYEFKNNNPDHIQSIGFLAQDVQKVFPELIAVNTTNEGNPEVEHQLGMDYSGLGVIAIKAIQEQQAEIEALKAAIEVLKETIRKQ